MKVLLDTHTFLWIARSPEKLSQQAVRVIENADERRFSLASIWELQIKINLGKIEVFPSLPLLVQEECRLNDFRLLPIEQDHIYRLAELPQHHGDPFDRMLVAQAQCEDLTIVTLDSKIGQYDVSVEW